MTVKINTPDVLHESFGEESVIVNLRQGVYYSLGSEGLLLWEEIARGASVDSLVELAARQSVNGVVLSSSAVLGFLRQLVGERLVVIEGESLPPPSNESDDCSKMSWLQKFEDLHDLLTLDPIHEVDERGWPHARSESSGPT